MSNRIKNKCCKSDNQPQMGNSRVDPFIAGILITAMLLLIGVVLLGIKMGATRQVTADEGISISVNSPQD